MYFDVPTYVEYQFYSNIQNLLSFLKEFTSFHHTFYCVSREVS